jgi:hypothetical protein
MDITPRIQLDPSRLLGFSQVSGARPGKITGPQAKVGVVVVPEPSTYLEFLVGILFLVFFSLRGRFRTKTAQPAPAPTRSGNTVGKVTPSIRD